MDKLIIDGTQKSKHAEDQKIQLSTTYLYSVLEIVNDENEYRRKEIDCVDYWKRKVELSCSNGQAMNDNN